MTRRSTIMGLVGIVIILAAGLVYQGRHGGASTPVRIGYFQSHMGSAPILVGESQGFFAKEGVTEQRVINGSSNLAMDALVRGDIDMSMLSMIPVLNAEAIDSGKVKIFAVSTLTNEKPFDEVVVKNDSEIKDVQGLAGKKIAVFPGTTATAFLKHYLESQKVDVSKIEFVQLPLAQHLQALESGSVQAAYMYEPVLSVALVAGNVHAITQSVYATVSDKSPIGVYVVSTKFLNEHADVAAKAVKALDEAMAYSNAHPAEAAQAVGTEFKLDPAVTARMSLMNFIPVHNVEPAFLKSFIDMLVSFGEVKGQPNLDTLLYR